MTAAGLCACPQCRRGIRRVIADEFRRQRRWMGYYTIRFEARLHWLPAEYYREVMAEMVGLGLLVRSVCPDDDFPRYLLWSLAAAAGKAVPRV